MARQTANQIRSSNNRSFTVEHKDRQKNRRRQRRQALLTRKGRR